MKGRMKSRLHAVELRRAQRGWQATLRYSVPTQRQFTAEECVITNQAVGCVPAPSHSLAVTLWRMYWYAKKMIYLVQSIPGPFPGNVGGGPRCRHARYKV